MYQLIRLGNCIHMFDKQNCIFVKSNSTNIYMAVDIKQQTTRKKILKSVVWVQCTDPNCRFHNCRQNNNYWLAKNMPNTY